MVARLRDGAAPYRLLSGHLTQIREPGVYSLLVGLSGLTWHIRGITALAIAFVVVGALIRLDGLG
jgi:hypothetical protein